MRTIGKRLPAGHGPDRCAICSYCGVQWLRSQLRRDASGNLACPDDAPGLDVVSLSEGNARLMRSQGPRSIGPNDGGYDYFVSPPDPGFIDPNGPPPAGTNQGPTGTLSVVTNMWLRSDNYTLSPTTGKVQALPDLSGRGNNMLATIEAEQALITVSDASLGGYPTISGAGASRMVSQFAGGASLWGWMIYKTVFSTGSTLLDAGVTMRQGGTPGTVQLAAGTSTTAENGTPGDNVWARAMIYFTVVGMDLLVKAALNSAASGGQRFTPGTTLFSNFAGSAKAYMVFAELILTNGPPNAAEVAAIDAYGIARYGANLFA
jgi:hypothetical protein